MVRPGTRPPPARVGAQLGHHWLPNVALTCVTRCATSDVSRPGSAVWQAREARRPLIRPSEIPPSTGGIPSWIGTPYLPGDAPTPPESRIDGSCLGGYVALAIK